MSENRRGLLDRVRGEWERDRDLEIRLWDRYGEDRRDRECEYFRRNGDRDRYRGMDLDRDREYRLLDRDRDRYRERLENDRDRDR